MKQLFIGLASTLLLTLASCAGVDYAALNEKAESQYETYLEKGTSLRFSQEEYSAMISYYEDNLNAYDKLYEGPHNDTERAKEQIFEIKDKFPYVSMFECVLDLCEDQLNKKNYNRLKHIRDNSPAYNVTKELWYSDQESNVPSEDPEQTLAELAAEAEEPEDDWE